MIEMVSGAIDADVAALARARPRKRFEGGEILSDDADGPPEVHLFISGTAVLYAETPFGPHPVGALRSPVLLDLRQAFGGSPHVCRIVPATACEAAVFTPEETRRLLFDTGPEGAAFRRLALASLTTALRETNASLAHFFDSPVEAGAEPPGPDSPRPEAAFSENPDRAVDEAHAGALFDAAGLDPSILPELGLSARTVPAGTTLIRAGTRGSEAFLVAEGRLRVSLDIPGAGEEALAILGPGEIVGEMALVDDAPRSADVVAHDGDALVYVLSRDVFRRLLTSADAKGAPLLGGLAIVLTRRLEEALKKTAAFRILAGPI
jgi:CRP/FNR family cyclic AMP-dependent transcriptional regulator